MKLRQFATGLRIRWNYVEIPYAKMGTVVLTVFTTLQLLGLFAVTGAALPFSLSFLGAFLSLPILNPNKYSVIAKLSPVLVVLSVAFSEFVVFKAAQTIAPNNTLMFTLLWSICSIGPVMFFKVLWYVVSGIIPASGQGDTHATE